MAQLRLPKHPAMVGSDILHWLDATMGSLCSTMHLASYGLDSVNLDVLCVQLSVHCCSCSLVVALGRGCMSLHVYRCLFECSCLCVLVCEVTLCLYVCMYDCVCSVYMCL